ncbi:unnamed protein product [Adineta ricciae]|uniref:Innexin n=1 Tax=Adineta ricciae TaxID=249248 RepID=A0A814CS57_ADIRI|nr:unnamed protein product [Adineta ricciae]CAF0961442.1 unnamed protein product [Adineta ricciae]
MKNSLSLYVYLGMFYMFTSVSTTPFPAKQLRPAIPVSTEYKRLATHCFIDDYTTWSEKYQFLLFMLRMADVLNMADQDRESLSKQWDQMRLQQQCLRFIERLPVSVGPGPSTAGAMEWITTLISEIYTYLEYRDDTGIDRLNRLYTVAILSAFVTLITTQQYVVGDPILCWMPKDVPESNSKFAHDTCWLGHTNYYVPQNATTLEHPTIPRTSPFTIYPWLPVALIGMTVSFILPYLLIWHGFSSRTGINIKRLMKIDKQHELKQTINYILKRKYSYDCLGGNYVMCVYLLMKILYIFILIGQLFFVNKLITGFYFQFDPKYLLEILSVKHDMWTSAHFPIETMCDFMVRMLGDINNWYTIQCILPFNLFTKRIFVLLLIWFSVLLMLNLIDFIFVWLYQRVYSSDYRYEYIFRLVHIYKSCLYKDDIENEIMLTNDCEIHRREFVHGYLKLDGYLLLKFLHGISTDMDMSHLVVYLYAQFIRMKHDASKKYERKTIV